jgi:hypothetical protein
MESLAGGSDGTVRLWDVGRGSEIAALQGHENWVRSVAFSPDGTRIVSGSVQSVAFSPDGTRIVSGGSDGTVRLWDVGRGSEIAALQGHEGWVRGVAFSPDGIRIVSGGSDGTVRLWDVGRGSEIAALQGHENWVQSVAFNPDGTRLVAGGNDGTVRLWGLILVTPPLLIWILLPAAIFNLFVCVRIFSTAWRAITVLQPNVPALVSDRPIADPKQATAAMREVVTRISHFVRNPNASAPLTFAVIGQWGSGKSSLMQLIWKDLRDDRCPCVWFNAWHHQNETHLFAALMESIRLNAVPRSLREIGRILEFRINLFWQRCWNTPIAVIMFVLVIPGVILWLGWKDFEISWSKAFLVAPIAGFWVSSSWNPLRVFGVKPASLIRASAAWIQFPRFRDRLSFRHQFGRAFGEVCKAFGYRRLVIIIDDLDRCRPEQIVEILEAVNFLTSSGDCFVLLGIDESQVEHAVGLHYRDIAEEMEREKQQSKDNAGNEGKNGKAKTNATDGMSETDEYEARRSYAQHYLKKLINLKVKVPVVDDQDLSTLREAGQS